jgi:hypothetical protein
MMRIQGNNVRTWFVLFLSSLYWVDGTTPVARGDEGGGNRFRRLNPLVGEIISVDSFEDGTYGSYTRASSGGTAVKSGSTLACLGTRAVLITGVSYFRHANVYNVANYVNFRLSFKYRPRNLEGTDAFTVAYTQDSANVAESSIRWTVVKRIQLGTDFTSQNTCLSASFLFFAQPTSISQIRLRFKAEAGTGDEFYVDDIVFEGIRGSLTPGPTQLPTRAPTSLPTRAPTSLPTRAPTSSPTTRAPTSLPTRAPTSSPTTRAPTSSPTTRAPTSSPTTRAPTSRPTNAPSLRPTSPPTNVPSSMPSSQPSDFLDRSEICPLNRTFPPEKYMIQEYTGPVQISNVEDDLSEISALVFTTLTDTSGSRYAYVVSDKNQFSLKVIKFADSADTQQVITGTATTVAVYKLTNINFTNSDWEDLSLGPCSDEGPGTYETCIYIGNFGNNNRGGVAPNTYVQRTELEIYKFREPAFTGIDSTPINRDIKTATITYNYGNFFQASDVNRTERFDAEAMFVDWTGAYGEGMGDIYVVLKGGCEGVGRISVSLHRSLNLDPSLDHNPITSNKKVNVGAMEKVMADDPIQGTSNGIFTCNSPEFRVWNGADMSRNGRLIAMIAGLSPARVYFFPRQTGQTVVEALSGVGCDFVSATSYGLLNERQHEAVAFVDEEGTIFAETSECNSGRACKVPTYIHRLVFQGGAPTGSVPVLNYPCGWQAITYDDFEPPTSSSLQPPYNIGENYVTLPVNVTDPDAVLSTSNSCRNSQSVKLRWHNGNSSSIFHSVNRDCSAYSYLMVTFQFRLVDFDHMDALFLELSLDGGIDYYIVHSWAFDVNGITANGVCYRRSVVLHAGDFNRLNFGNSVRLRFRTSANAKGDTVFIDDIRFEGHSGTPVICV